MRWVVGVVLLLIAPASATAQKAPAGAFSLVSEVSPSIVQQERYRRGDRLRDCASRKRFRDNSIDMGTGYDCFDAKAHPFAASVTKKQRRNRLRLRRAMLAAGFKGLATEWWHFTLRGEPYPETYFDFPVARSSVSG